MDLTPEQKRGIERLHENESLTDNLDDASAQALLDWAEDRIRADTDSSLVTAAVSAANQSGEASVQALVNNASAFLAQELSVRTQAGAPGEGGASAPAPLAESAPQDSATQPADTPPTAPELKGADTPGVPGTLSVDVATPPPQLLSTSASAGISPAQKPHRRKKSSRRKKKK